jgi:hypothetical protein
MTKAKTSPQPQMPREGKVGRKALPTPRPAKVTKKAQLISLLSKNAGSDVDDISKRFGWLPHTTRAALTRLRQAGYKISSEKTGKSKTSKYRITGAPMEQNAQ